MYTPIKLDKDRNILLGFEALQLFKKLTGKSLLKLKMQEDDIEDYIPAIFYVGLKHEDKDITLEEVTQLIDKHLGIIKAVEKFYEVFEEQLTPDNDSEKN